MGLTQVEVRTWFEAQGRIAARRDWEMSDVTDGSSEKVIARATSSWIAFNLEKRKLARIPQSVLDEFQTQSPARHAVMGDAHEVEKLPDVRGMPGVTLPESHSVRRTDLDMNNHVNNVVYTEWLLESVPDAFWEKYDLREIILEFRNECHDGDNVDAICCRECGEEGVLNCEEKPGQATLVHMLLKGVRHVPEGRRWCVPDPCGAEEVNGTKTSATRLVSFRETRDDTRRDSNIPYTRNTREMSYDHVI